MCHFNSILINRFFARRHFFDEIHQLIFYCQIHDTTNVVQVQVSQNTTSHVFQQLNELIAREFFFLRFSQCINSSQFFFVIVFYFSCNLNHLRQRRKRFFQRLLVFMMRVSTFFIAFYIFSKSFCFNF